MNTFSHADLIRVLRSDFYSFVQKAFATLNPGETFVPNWHLQAICYQVERVLSGECKQLLVNQPPRGLKSFILSICLPAFLLGCMPSAKIITVSYSQSLADEFSLKTRSLMQSDWYKEAFPNTRLSDNKNTVSEYQTTQFGYRMATSVGGTLTGRGAIFIILDDVQKADDAASHTQLHNIIRWFESTLLTRLNNQKEGRMIVVQQRLHMDDLSGYLLEKGGWDHLSLQAMADEDQLVRLSDKSEHLYQKGEVLHPAFFDEYILSGIEDKMGSYAFSAQYQQKPVPAKGNLIPVQKFNRFETYPTKQPGDMLVQSWDLAQGEKDANDYSVGTTWLIRMGSCFLLDVFREKLAYPALHMKIHEMGRTSNADTILIENASVGGPMIEDLKVGSNLTIIGVPVTHSKFDRMVPCTADIEGGRVWLPKEAPWLAEFERECAAFPYSKFDDQVDSMSQFLNWARERRKDDEECDNLLALLDGLSPGSQTLARGMTARQFYESLAGPGAKNLGHMVPMRKFPRR